MSVRPGTVGSMDRSENDEACTPTELTPEMGGRWEVDTGNSIHVWDLDAMTYIRQPGPTARPLSHDGVEVTIKRVHTWPKLRKRFMVWFDDPNYSYMDHWRISSPVKRITPAGPATRDDPASPEA